MSERLNKSILMTYTSLRSTKPNNWTKQNKFYMACFQICTHVSFTVVITMLILANTVVLALERHPIPEREQEINENLNSVFSLIFMLEMFIKIFGLGFKEYAKDPFNIFDALIVIMSATEFVIEITGFGTGTSGALSAFRGVRLLRVFKLARSW